MSEIPYPLFINAFETAHYTETLQHVIGEYLGQSWAWNDINWKEVIPSNWIDIDLVPVSSDSASLKAMQFILDEKIRGANVSLNNRPTIIFIGLYEDAVCSYGGFAAFVQRAFPQSIVAMMTIHIEKQTDNVHDWNIPEMVPNATEFSWDGK